MPPKAFKVKFENGFGFTCETLAEAEKAALKWSADEVTEGTDYKILEVEPKYIQAMWQ
jgi:hypothetical protein